MMSLRLLPANCLRGASARQLCLLIGLLLACIILPMGIVLADLHRSQWISPAAAAVIVLHTLLLWRYLPRQTPSQPAAAQAVADQVHALRAEFLSTLSHEIRTPMNAIVGLADVLATTPLDAQQEGLSAGIDRAAKGLLAIIDDISDCSKIEAGAMSIEARDFNLSALVESCSKQVAGLAQAKGLRLSNYIDGQLPTVLLGDAQRLHQILFKLLSNAVKFTDVGVVSVDVRLVQQQENDCLVRFEVKDSGIGIDSRDQARLFMPFAQADGSVTRKYGGVGLGLAICKGLVDLMGGSIGVGSHQQRGSVFWFELHLPQVRAAQQEPALAGELLLLAPDDELTRALHDYAVAFGLSVRRATSVAAGQEMLSQLAPGRVLVLDTALAGFTQEWLAAATVRPLEGGILLAAHEDARADLSALTGMTILLLPLSRSAWYGALAKALQPARPAPPPAPVRAADSRYNIDGRLVLLVEDNLMNQKVAVHQLHQLGYAVDVVVNGREALAALEAHRYAAVLMDCQMPVMDGLEATRLIREREHSSGRHTPIIAMTANTMNGDRELCLQAGMDDYLSKPILRERLDSVLCLHIQPRPHNGELPDVLDMKRLFDLFDDDRDTICAMLDLFIIHTGPILSQLQYAAAHQDVAQAATLLHRLVGACSNLGALQMTVLAQAAESAIKNDGDEYLRLLCSELFDAFQRLRDQTKKMKEAI